MKNVGSELLNASLFVCGFKEFVRTKTLLFA